MKNTQFLILVLLFLVQKIENSKLTVQARLNMNMERRDDDDKDDKDEKKQKKDEKKDPNIIYRGWLKFQLIKFEAETGDEMQYFEIN